MFFSFNHNKKQPHLLKQIFIIIAVILLFMLIIHFMTADDNKDGFSANMMTTWTSDLDSTMLFNLLALENRALQSVNEEQALFTALPKTIFHLMTSIRPNDFRSLLGNELPGFSIFDAEILIAGEGTDYTNLPIESTFPLDDVLEDREAVYEEETDEQAEEEQPGEEMEKRNVVFIYNTHNRESFLPHLPDITNSDLAHHKEVNITLVSNRLQQALEDKGIGSVVDETDIIGEVLVERDWEYWQSYQASREVVSEAISQNQDLQFAFDLHRDSVARDLTTKEINGEHYARVMFVIGKDNPDLEKNFQLARTLHERFEEDYPGLSRGVWPQGGAGNNGVYNQDLSENALLLEIGGVGNTLEEAYRTADALAEVFSDYYWEAEAVQGNQEGEK